METIKIGKKQLAVPSFFPDATRGFIKSIDNEAVLKTGTSAMVVNTFHLYLRPGLKIIKKAGGIHKFMNWPGILLSDSGGFQIFSLIHRNPKMGKIINEGAHFKSPLDGSRHFISPEKSIQIQFDLGTDMMVVLDDCPPNDFGREAIEKSITRTVEWARRSKEEYLRQIKKRKISPSKKPKLLAVIQGGVFVDLRQKCARELIAIGFDGYGFGARPVDEKGKFLTKVLSETVKIIPAGKIKFALGIGTPEDIIKCYKMGWELFDCVIPTREGRHGKLMVFKDKKSLAYKVIKINNSRFAKDFSLLQPGVSLAYLHHLFKSDDPLGGRIASLNNLEFYQKLVCRLKQKNI